MTVSRMAYMDSAYRNLIVNQNSVAKSLRNISSGFRINSGADDAAGLAVSEKMRGQIGGLSKAYTNTTAGVSLIQTAEGSLDKTSAILVRMKELAVQASNGTYNDDDRALLNKEFTALKSEIDRLSGATNYNGMNLLDGTLGGKKGLSGVQSMGVAGFNVGGTQSFTGEAKFNISTENGQTSITARFGSEVITNVLNASDTGTSFTLEDGTQINMDFRSTAASLTNGVISNIGVNTGSGVASTVRAMSADAGSELVLQVGANGSADQRIAFKISDMSTLGLGLDKVSISTADGAKTALDAIESAIKTTAGQRGTLGATQNRLEHTMNNLGVASENLIDAESTIRDVDIAKEMMKYYQKSMLVQASQAMLAQGMNLSQQNMLGLLLR